MPRQRLTKMIRTGQDTHSRPAGMRSACGDDVHAAATMPGPLPCRWLRALRSPQAGAGGMRQRRTHSASLRRMNR